MKLLLGYYYCCCCVILLLASSVVVVANSQEEAAAVGGATATKIVNSYDDWKTFVAGDWKYCPIGNGIQYLSGYDVCQVIRFTCDVSVPFFNNCGCGCYYTSCHQNDTTADSNDDAAAAAAAADNCEFGFLPENGVKKEGEYEIIHLMITTESSTTDTTNTTKKTTTTTTDSTMRLESEALDVVEAANSIYEESFETMTFPSYEDWKSFLEGNRTYCPIMSGLQYVYSYQTCQMDSFTSTCGNSTESVVFFNNCGCGCYQKSCNAVGGDNNNVEECNINTTPNYPTGGAEAKNYYGLNVIITNTTSDNSNYDNAKIMANDETGTDGSSSSSNTINSNNNNSNTNNADDHNTNGIECNYGDTSSSFRDVYNSYTYGVRVTIDHSASSSRESSSLYACAGSQSDIQATTTATNTMLDTNNNNDNMVAIQSRGMKPSMYTTGYYKVNVLEVYNNDDEDEEALLLSTLNDNNSLLLFYENEDGNYRKEWDMISSTSPDDNNDNSFIIFPMLVPESKNCVVEGNKNLVYIDKCSEGFHYSSISQDDIDYLTAQNKRLAENNHNNYDSGSNSSIALSYYYGMMMMMMMMMMMICVV